MNASVFIKNFEENKSFFGNYKIIQFEKLFVRENKF
jgi:hypothetical protein